MSTCILTTTVNIPGLLREYAANAHGYGHREVEFVVVGDLKTPEEVGALCAQWGREWGCGFTYLSVARQKAYMKRFPRLDRLVPWNSIQRRNIGLLYALDQGHDVVITIDDDNYLIPGSDFIGDHITGLGTMASQRMVRSASGWFNCIAMMETNFGVVYPRGFPLGRRWQKEDWQFSEAICRPVVNAGLWIGDPDIDALTRLYYPVETRLPLAWDYVTLAAGCWCPINTQNTAFHRPAALLAFVIVMGSELAGLKVARYDDIWMSWFLRTVMDHLGDAVRYGRPVVRQQRNDHNLFRDLREELPAMEVNQDLIAACQSVRLTGATYLECYCELAQQLKESLAAHPCADFFRQLTEQMEIWAEAVDAVVQSPELIADR